MLSLRFMILLSGLITGNRASTHWMVTENGLVEPRLTSPFEMANPHDVLAFLNQDTLWENIKILYQILTKRNEAIRELWIDIEKASDVNSHLDKDENCKEAGPINMLDWYTSFMEDGKLRNIAEEDYKLDNPFQITEIDVPDCKRISSLTFSMFAFEHLEAMIKRENLTVNAELSLPEQISPKLDVDQFGHWVSSVLRLNGSSWLHYNMASLYWRVIGNAPKAIECSRRAIHYAPREYKDIALLSLGTLFHRSKYTDDAVVVLEAAVDHYPLSLANHFVLANAYTVIGDFDNSLIHYEHCLKLDEQFDLATKHKHGMQCHSMLYDKLRDIQGIVETLKVMLRDYRLKEGQWLKSQAAALRAMHRDDNFDVRLVERCCDAMTALTGLDMRALKAGGDRHALLQYYLEGALYDDKWRAVRGTQVIEAAHILHRLVQHVSQHVDVNGPVPTSPPGTLARPEPPAPPAAPGRAEPALLATIGPVPEILDAAPPEPTQRAARRGAAPAEDDHYAFEGGVVLYPSTTRISRNTEPFDTEPEWPRGHCDPAPSADTAAPDPAAPPAAPAEPVGLSDVHPVFLPFENKGLKLDTLLTDMLGVPGATEHPLPWHPPVCPPDADPARRGPRAPPAVAATGAARLRARLLRYADGGPRTVHDTEIGHRIYAAINMNLAPKWILYTLASLYWRVRANNANARRCLSAAARAAPPRFRDVPLTSLASVYLEMGCLDEAAAAAEEALKINLYEPATNFLLSQLYMARRARRARGEADATQTVRSLSAQLYHLKQTVRVEPGYMGGFARTLLAGWACYLAAMQELRDAAKTALLHDIHVFPDLTERVLDAARAGADGPAASGRGPEALGHALEEYDAMFEGMRRRTNLLLQGCGPMECRRILPEDVNVRPEDCAAAGRDLGPWQLSFGHLMEDCDISRPELPPRSPRPFACPAAAAPVDFVSVRLRGLRGDGWRPRPALMAQLTEWFGVEDPQELGQRLAALVEAQPDDYEATLMAGWWCSAAGRGACAVRCLRAAARRAPAALLSLAAVLHAQSRLEEAKDIAYLIFYLSPQSKLASFLVAVSHTYMKEYEQALWMYQYALSFDGDFLPAQACLRVTACLMLDAQRDASAQ